MVVWRFNRRALIAIGSSTLSVSTRGAKASVFYSPVISTLSKCLNLVRTTVRCMTSSTTSASVRPASLSASLQSVQHVLYVVIIMSLCCLAVPLQMHCYPSPSGRDGRVVSVTGLGSKGRWFESRCRKK